MCGAIDSTLGAIFSGILHSRVGVCDPHGLFAKRVLHSHPHGVLSSAWVTSRVPKAPTLNAGFGTHDLAVWGRTVKQTTYASLHQEVRRAYRTAQGKGNLRWTLNC
jgi:hypothetical protein